MDTMQGTASSDQEWQLPVVRIYLDYQQLMLQTFPQALCWQFLQPCRQQEDPCLFWVCDDDLPGRLLPAGKGECYGAPYAPGTRLCFQLANRPCMHICHCCVDIGVSGKVIDVCSEVRMATIQAVTIHMKPSGRRKRTHPSCP